MDVILDSGDVLDDLPRIFVNATSFSSNFHSNIRVSSCVEKSTYCTMPEMIYFNTKDSSGSSGRVRGARNMKSMQLPLAVIFYDLFLQGA